MSQPSNAEPVTVATGLVGRHIASNSLLSLGVMVTGFAVQVVTAKFFGASPEMDAFLVGFLLLSFLLTQLQAGGIASTAFIPPFNAAIQEGAREARSFFTTTVVLACLVAACLSSACLLLATEIVHAIGPGLSPEAAALAVKVFRVFSLLFLPLTLAALLSASLQAESRFVASAFAPVAINCCVIVSLVFLATRAGIMSYVFGLSLGLLVQCVILLRPLTSWPTIDLSLLTWKNPRLRVLITTTCVSRPTAWF